MRTFQRRPSGRITNNAANIITTIDIAMPNFTRFRPEITAPTTASTMKSCSIGELERNA